MGLFITFEGIEGCGKTTQLNLAARALIERGYEVITTAEPGGTALGKRIREVLLKSDLSVSAEAELLLFMADRVQHVREVINPALSEGKVVLCDRFFDATLAYQGYGRGIKIEAIKEIYALAVGNLHPDMTLLFDLNLKEGFNRLTQRKGEIDRLEREGKDFHHRVRLGYLALAEEDPARIRVVDASGEVKEVHATVMTLIEEVLKKKGYGIPPHSRS